MKKFLKYIKNLIFYYFLLYMKDLEYPIIEAQACGLPVITSHLSPMLEVSSKYGAIHVNPFSIQSIQNGILKVINNDRVISNLRMIGMINSQKYKLNNIKKNIITFTGVFMKILLAANDFYPEIGGPYEVIKMLSDKLLQENEIKKFRLVVKNLMERQSISRFK